MDDLIARIRAAIDEEDRIARATQGCDCGGCNYELTWLIEDDWVTELNISVGHTSAPGYINPQQARHVVRQDPERTLRRVAAQRKILDLHEPLDCGAVPYTECRACHGSYVCWPCPTIRALADACGIEVPA